MEGQSRIEVMDIVGSEDREVVRVTDINVAAYMLSHGLELKDVQKNPNTPVGKRVQRAFIIRNVTNVSVKDWVMDFYNNKALTPIQTFLDKLRTLRDLINTDVDTKKG